MISIAKKDDYQQIANIVELLRAQADFKMQQFNWNSDSIIEELEKAQTLVVQENQQIVSFLCFRESLDFVEITALATKPSRQKQGWQGLLLEDLKSRYGESEKSILLEVHIQNLKAKTLYTHKGFEEISRRKNYYTDGGDALVLQLKR